MLKDSQEKYFNYLLGCIDIKGHRSRNYTRVLKVLFDKEFYSLIEMDENRQADGLYLRKNYLINDIPFKVDKKTLIKKTDYCSVLEMMVALAQRMEQEFMHDPTLGDRTGEWFWIMMTNLGLDQMDNDEFDEKIADDTINSFLSRSYKDDGEGCLFRTKSADLDLKNVDIWGQMNIFIDEYF